MAEKSVIQIDVQDGSFKTFAAIFAKFKGDTKEAAKETANLVDQTANVAVQNARVAAEKKKIVAEQEKLAKLTKEERDDLELEAKAKARVAAIDKKSNDAKRKAWDDERKRYATKHKAIEDARKDRADDIKSAKEMAKWTADIARNLASGAASLGKWLAFGAIASGFGLGGLAAGASNTRRTAQHAGIRAGELRAANVNLGRYIDPESALSNIATTKDSSDRWIFGRVGVNTQGKDSAAILAEYLPKVVDAFRRTGLNTTTAEQSGLTKIVSAQDLIALAGLPKGELDKALGNYQKDRRGLEEGDEVDRTWQEFMVSMHRASQEIEVSLLGSLKTITPYLNDLAKGVAAGIKAFAENGGLQHWIEALGGALQKLGAYLGSKEFSDDVDKFMRAIHVMATKLGKLFPDDIEQDSPAAAARAAGKPVPESSLSTAAGNMVGAPMRGSAWSATGGVYKAIWDHLVGNDKSGAKAARVSSLESQYKLPKGLLDQVWYNETRRGQGSTLSPAGAGGEFQFMPGVAAQYGIKDRWNFEQSSDAAARLLKHLLSVFNGDTQKALAAYNAGEGRVGEAVSQFGPDWLKHLKPETQNYGGVRVVIQNQTGGSAQATVAAMAPN